MVLPVRAGSIAVGLVTLGWLNIMMAQIKECKMKSRLMACALGVLLVSGCLPENFASNLAGEVVTNVVTAVVGAFLAGLGLGS